MAVHSGAITLTRYRVLGLKKNLTMKALGADLDQNKAGRIRLQGVTRPESVGWSMPKTAATEDLQEGDYWDLSHCRLETGYLLRMRIEKRSVPQELLRLEFLARISKKESRRANPLSRAERKELKDGLSEELMGKTLPSISYVDAMWDDSKGTLMLFSGGKRLRELFEHLFRKTFLDAFEGALVRVDPPLLGITEKQWRTPASAKSIADSLSKTIPLPMTAETHPSH